MTRQEDDAWTDDLVSRLWTEIAKLPMSVSHDRWHIERVMGFALRLQELHGGSRDVLAAAVLLHDLGRADTATAHGIESIEASVEIAEALLLSVDYPKDRVQLVLRAINEHDQPDLRPGTIEGRILKEADFLAGVGAWGVLRIAMWSGETGRKLDVVMDRLRRGMARRVDSLQFPESVAFAHQETAFARLFAERLGLPAGPLVHRHSEYIILEGTSGSGKDTQAKLLKAHLEAAGRDAIIVFEPGPDFRHYKSVWRGEHHTTGPVSARVATWLLMADRQEQIDSVVVPALERGQTVISVRSYLSTLVYQGQSRDHEAMIAFAHSFVPSPDRVILFDVSASTALQRIAARNTDKGDHETLEQLTQHRERYLELGPAVFGTRWSVINAEQAPADVLRDTVAAIANPPSARQTPPLRGPAGA